MVFSFFSRSADKSSKSSGNSITYSKGLRINFGDQGEVPHSIWPKRSILSALKHRYGSLEQLGEERGYLVYGVVENDIRFAIIMVKEKRLAKKSDGIVEVGFVARFQDFSLPERELQSINGNLHISVMTPDAGGDLFLVGGVVASGEFNEGSFQLVLDAWRRDIAIALQSITGTSLLDTHPALQSQAALEFAINRPREDISQNPSMMLQRFLGDVQHQEARHSDGRKRADRNKRQKLRLF